jgi:hypothetical protein
LITAGARLQAKTAEMHAQTRAGHERDATGSLTGGVA